MSSFLSSLATPLLRVALPHACESCRHPTDGWLCPTCLADFQLQCADAMCDLCGYPLVGHGDPCPRCLHRPGRLIHRTLRLSLHAGIARDLVHHLKYTHRWTLARPLAEAMYQRPEIRDLLESTDLLVPIPLHWWRYWKRGYNQASLLARELSRITHHRTIRALRRTRETETQSALHSMAARVRNVRDAFIARRAEIQGQRILLIDDVATTTATLRAAARALKPLNPAQVNALVLTMADPRTPGAPALDT